MFKVDHKDQNVVTDWVDVSHRQLQVIWQKIYPVTVTNSDVEQVMSKFHNKHGFLQGIGAIDGTHITI